MRIISEKFESTGEGMVTLKMDYPEDLWPISNVLSNGDIVKSTTFRKIKEESKTGSVVTQKRKIVLFLRVKSVEYDPESNHIRVGGTCAAENKFVQMNQHHTIELVLHVAFTIKKKWWDSLHLETLREAANPAQNASVAALVMEEGLGHLCLITPHATIVKARIESQIPRKRKGFSGHSRALSKFFEKCSLTIQQNIEFEVIKCLLVASPGFVKEQFAEFLEATRPQWYNPKVIVYAHASSGEKYALADTLLEPSVKESLANVEFTQDLEIIDQFFKTLSLDPHKAAYSLIDVEISAAQKAVESLIISDSLLKTKRLANRRRIVDVVQSVRSNGGLVKVVSTLHLAGERLQQLSGIAAILRFPVYDLQEHESVSEEEHSDEENQFQLNVDELDADDADLE